MLIYIRYARCAASVMLLLATGIFAPNFVSADVIHLVNGNLVEVREWRDLGDAVEFEQFGGTVQIPKAHIRSIEREAPAAVVPVVPPATGGAAPGKVAPAAARAAEETYMLRLEGAAAAVTQVSLNNAEIVGRAAPWKGAPVPVTAFLKDGFNWLQVGYAGTLAPGEAAVVIERRGPAGAGEEIVRLTRSGTVTSQSRRFVVALAGVGPPSIALTDADKEALRALLRRYHAALARKDAAEVRRLFARAGRPEHLKIHEESLPRLFSSPQFRMKPLTLEGLAFATRGELAIVSRPDGAAVVESEAVEIVEETVVTVGGKETRTKGTARLSVALTEVLFRKTGAEWHFTFGF